MGRITVMMSARSDAPMSSHFGKAEWIMMAGAENAAPEFTKNDGSNGRSAAEILIGLGCTDAIVVDIGDGALRHLQAADIRVWAAPGPVTGSEALRIFAEGRLPCLPAVSAATSHGGGHGCCCAGRGAAHASSGCCG